MSNFWWGSQGDKKKVHWLNWKEMCLPKNKGGMGFKDLHLYNNSLLAKQGWGLVQEPHSLLARMLKAKYYPHGSFWEASIEYNPSYSWRSIRGARKIVEEGILWRVGNGNQISLWKDRWIPSPNTYKVGSPQRVLGAMVLVSELVDPHTQYWNPALIDNVFLPHEAEIIKRIPINTLAHDRVIWAHFSSGIFSIKSAYSLAVVDLQDRDKPGGGESSGGYFMKEIMWQSIWKARVPNKIKIFIWRACKDILPIGNNLFKRRVVPTNMCFVCHKDIDSSCYSIWSCLWSKGIWKLDPFFANIQGRRYGDFLSVNG